MLRTPRDTLKAIYKKEETEFKMETTTANKRKNPNQLTASDKDHLPFAKLKIKIAASMPDAPKLPTFKVSLTFE